MEVIVDLAAEFEACRPAGVALRQPAAPVHLGELLAVKGEIGGKVFVAWPAAERAGDAGRQFADVHDAGSSPRPRRRAMIEAVRSQSASSRASCARPARVSA